MLFEKEINKIGEIEASGWGAYITDYEMLDDHPTNPTIRYFAIEHKESFYFDMKLWDVIKEYKKYMQKCL